MRDESSGQPGARNERCRHLALLIGAVMVLGACGGGDSAAPDSSRDGALAKVRPPPPPPPPPPSGPADLPANEAEARRFLTQATFGPTDASVARLMTLGYEQWFAEQFATPQTRHEAGYNEIDVLHTAQVGYGVGQPGTLAMFWKTALTGDDQLRQRVAYALAQIFVVSMQDAAVGSSGAGPSNYLDMLADKGLGNFRTLLENVTLHPLMGSYLAHLRNRGPNPAADPAPIPGAPPPPPPPVPDENFSRELMQLFTVGLIKLKPDGTPLLSQFKQPQPTYAPADVTGLAHVFTGFSYDCRYTDRQSEENCFFWGLPSGNQPQWVAPMIGYSTYHSTAAKSFLGTNIAAGSANPAADMTVALNLLFNHPNVGPFIGRQLIQRLVTSNPSPTYIKDVAATFDNNGAGVRGDMRAVVKRILTHPQAKLRSDTAGKVREPILRMTAAWRAVGVTSVSGRYGVDNTDDTAYSLGQSMLRAPSVFNFYRPGFKAPLSQSGAAGLVAPELQIMNETSAAGYVNFVYEALVFGSGHDPLGGGYYDVRFDTTRLEPLAADSAALVAALNAKLFYGTMSSALTSEIVASLVNVEQARRVKTALLLALASPEYQTQR